MTIRTNQRIDDLKRWCREWRATAQGYADQYEKARSDIARMRANNTIYRIRSRNQKREARKWARKLKAQRDRETRRVVELLRELDDARADNACLRDERDYWNNCHKVMCQVENGLREQIRVMCEDNIRLRGLIKQYGDSLSFCIFCDVDLDDKPHQHPPACPAFDEKGNVR